MGGLEGNYARDYYLSNLSKSFHHLSLETLLLILHDPKVLQVQVDIVALLTVSCGHVPHNNEGPVPQIRTRSSHIRAAEVLRQRGAGQQSDEEDEKTKVRQHHGCSAVSVSFLLRDTEQPA